MRPDTADSATARALRCTLVAPGSHQLAITFWDRPLTGLTAGAAGAPAAFIIPVADLAPLRELGTVFVDRGRKHAAKSLSEVLLGHERVPIVDGRFAVAGQLERSVRTLLENARRESDRNAYVIGVADRLFTDIARKARSDSPRSASGGLIEPDEVPPSLCEKLIGDSPEMDLLRQMIVLASRHEEPVLILGDTGTGKEVAARQIHELDPARKPWTFMAINCSAISPELFESELFGYEPGAFTGARAKGKPGLWSVAGRGTLFLDELGDLSRSHQAKILRALETNKIRAVGGIKEIDVHCRVIAATNRDLYAMVQSGEFREDLYYRLRPCLIRTPRLRDHLQDIAALAEFFWESVAVKRPPLPVAVLTALQGYRWPGNARELRAVLVGLATMFPKGTPRVEHVRAVFQLQSATPLSDDRLGAADDARMHRGECLRHLRRADEVIRACKVLLRPFASHKTTDEGFRQLRSTLAHRVAELRMLLLQPMLFHTIPTLDVVTRLSGGLATVQSLVDHDPVEAQRYWKKNLSVEVTAALTTIMNEVERLLKKIG